MAFVLCLPKENDQNEEHFSLKKKKTYFLEDPFF